MLQADQLLGMSLTLPVCSYVCQYYVHSYACRIRGELTNECSVASKRASEQDTEGGGTEGEKGSGGREGGKVGH